MRLYATVILLALAAPAPAGMAALAAATAAATDERLAELLLTAAWPITGWIIASYWVVRWSRRGVNRTWHDWALVLLLGALCGPLLLLAEWWARKLEK